MTHEEELNKAAGLWIAGVFLAYSVPDTSVKELREIAEKSFIAGAKWAMGQGMIREGKIVSESGEVGWIEYDTPAQVELMEHFKKGDEIVLQIRKKN